MTTSNEKKNVGVILDELTLKGEKLEHHSKKIVHFSYETKAHV